MDKTKKSIFEKPLLSTKVKSANVKIPEMFFGYLLGPIGGLLASGIFGAFLNRYWTKTLFVNELAVDALGNPLNPSLYGSINTFLTLLPLLSAILIIAGNLVAGQIVERTRTKAGKARPWILLSSVVVAVSSVLMFIVPSENNIVKMVLMAISYNLYYAVGYPLYNTANSTLIPVSTRNGKQRGLLASVTNVAGLAVMGIGSMIFPVLLGLINADGNSNTWLILFIIVGVFSFVCCVLQYYFTRERVTEESQHINTAPIRIPVKKQLKAVAGEKFWWIIIIFYMLFQLSGGIKNLSMTYFCEMLVDNSFWGETLTESAAAGMTQTLIAVLGAIPMAIAMLFIWPLSNKFGKQKVVLIGCAVGVAGGIVAGISGDSVIGISIGVALKCFGSAPACYMILAMIADVLDHIEAKCGFRCDGLTMSIYSALMIASVPLAQGIFNGISQSGTNAAAVNISYIWLETIAYGICAVLMIFFFVEKKVPDDQKLIRERQKAETLAAGQEWIEPEERLRREEEEADAIADAARRQELKAKCEKKGLDYDTEEAKYQEALAQKKKLAEEKKAAAEAKKAAAEAKKAEKKDK